MKADHALAISSRIIRQFRHDRRTIAMIVLVPVLVMTLVGLSFPQTEVLDFIAPALLAAMALFFVFILTGVS